MSQLRLPKKWPVASTLLSVALGLASFGAYSLPGYAQQEDPIRAVSDLRRNASYEIQRPVRALSQARVALADYSLLRRDFPALAHMTEDAIDQWLLKQAGYISLPQTQQRQVNTTIPNETTTTSGFRPMGYGRALVFEVKDPNGDEVIGIIDSKGAGSENPAQRQHGNGLATLGECLREFIVENGIREALRNSGAPVSTVGSYAVIDAGFDVIHQDGGRSRAGLYLRQGHGRNTSGPYRVNESEMETLLKKYGIYAGGNIQLAANGYVYDFGHYTVLKDLGVEEKRFPYAQWGHPDNAHTQQGDTWGYSKLDFPWAWSHEAAEAFAQGRASRRDVLQHFKNFIQPLREKLDPCGTQLRPSL